MKDYGNDDKSALQAKFDAQKIAFGPIMFQAAKSLRDLGILDYLMKKRRKGATVEETAEALNLSNYGVKVLLEAAISLEMVMVRNNRFFITKTGYFILSDKLTRVNMDFTHDVNYLGMFHLQEAIEKGKPEGLKVFGTWKTIYEALSQLPEKVRESWFAFDHYYSDVAFPEVLPIIFEQGVSKLMDVGGNTGKFAIACAGYSDDVKVTILDLPGQLDDAKKNIARHGFEDKVDLYAIDLLDASAPFPKGHDAIWMSQFLDCFSQEEILTLLKRAYDALDENGALYILETYWDMQQFEASTYSLHATSLYFTAMANGNSQMYHSDDMRKLVKQSGMVIEKEFENIGVSHTLFKCVKA